MSFVEAPIPGIAKISKIHEDRLSFLLHCSHFRDASLLEYEIAVERIVAEAALKLAQLYETPGLKSDPGRVTAVYDKLDELRHLATVAIVLPRVNPLFKAPASE